MDSSTSTSSMTEREKMLAGLPYNAMQDQELVVARLRAKKLCRRYNNAPLAELDDPNGGLSSEQRAILKELFALTDEQSDQVRVHFSLAAAPHTGAQVYMEAPIQVDYGVNTIFLGPAYFNYNLILLDCARVTFGARVTVASSVSIYAATHSADDVESRRNEVELAFPVYIGNDVWIGGGAHIVGPVVIGDGATVAAGAVVVRDVEPFTVVGGNPARLLKRIPPVAPRPDDPTTPTPAFRPGRGS